MFRRTTFSIPRCQFILPGVKLPSTFLSSLFSRAVCPLISSFRKPFQICVSNLRLQGKWNTARALVVFSLETFEKIYVHVWSRRKCSVPTVAITGGPTVRWSIFGHVPPKCVNNSDLRLFENFLFKMFPSTLEFKVSFFKCILFEGCFC